MTGSDTPQKMLAIAIDAARRAGDLIRRGVQAGARDLTIESKGGPDLVTDVDRAAEAVIKRCLQQALPAHAILAEESGAESGNAYLWLVDPLDGTTNFAHGHPHCAVSIACLREGQPLLGLVFDPVRQELFSALADEPAHLNGHPIQTSDVTDLKQGLTATGFPYDRQLRPEAYLPPLEVFLRATQGVRRLGSAALDLAWLACGRLDLYFEPGLKAWDVAAGVILVQAAGGRVGNYAGAPLDILRPHQIAAANRDLFPQMIELLRPFHEE